MILVSMLQECYDCGSKDGGGFKVLMKGSRVIFEKVGNGKFEKFGKIFAS